MKALKTITIVAITGLAGLTAVQASPMQCEKPCKQMKQYKGKMKGVFKELDLTSAQKDQMKALREEMKTHREAKKGQRGKRGMGQMSKFVSANGFDKDGFIKMATEKSQERIKMRADMFEKRMNILTPEQRTKFIQLVQEKQK